MSKEKHAFKALSTLPKATIEEVERKLLAGEAPSVVAAWLQEDVGVFKNLKCGSLKKNLERYRARDLKDKVIQDLTQGTKGKSVAGIKKRLLAVDEMEELAAIQKGRLEKVLTQEAKTLASGIVLKYVSDEIRLMKETLVELGKLQLETGILKRAPKSVKGTVTDPSTGETREFTWTEEQEALFRQLDGIEYVDMGIAVEDAHTQP